MDYLDPKKQLIERIVLYVGYVLIAIAILFATLVLLYEADGFGFGKNGTIIQNGLIFLSSQPNPAQIYLNGQHYKGTTNTRIFLPSGLYQVKLSRTGYRPWNRTISLIGGTVMHFDYPFLVPTTLKTSKLQNYTSAPGLVTQSPDRRWLLVQLPGSDTSYDLYDLKNPNSKPTPFTIPATIVSKATTSESWQLEEWADDNQHVVLEHHFDGRVEFIMIDRANPDQSINLNTTLNANPTDLSLNNKKYDQYYLYDSSTQSLDSASLGSPTLVNVLSHVLAYQSYSNNTVLYVTNDDAPTGKVLVKLTTGSQTYIVHSFPIGANYLLNLTTYSGILYVVAGASNENKVYIFRDPIGQLAAEPSHAVVPIQVLHVTAPNYVSFSDNTQFIVAENGPHFGVYDIENKNGYNYTTTLPLDQPQVHATWMDGDRLVYVSGGKEIMFDYDDVNQQTLITQNPAYLPAFSTNYTYLYGIANGDSPNQIAVTQTSLLTPADQ